MSYPVPILLIAFNRPSTTIEVISVLRQLRPSTLYVACDGPRSSFDSDNDLCATVRSLFGIHSPGLIDWPCKVHKLFQPNNVGCRRAVTSAINWFFENEPEGVILEDDILPDLSFFYFCQQLLAYYRHDDRIGSISANNHQLDPPADGTSYRFSIYTHCWGWATWRRAWIHNDSTLSTWISFRQSGWLTQIGGHSFAHRWQTWLDSILHNELDTWDIVWQYSFWRQGFLSIIPSHELVSNIGFSADATHTIDESSPLGPRGHINFPLVHPTVFLPDKLRDLDTYNKLYKTDYVRSILKRARKLKRLFFQL